jgi:hypothetical protein
MIADKALQTQIEKKEFSIPALSWNTGYSRLRTFRLVLDLASNAET